MSKVKYVIQIDKQDEGAYYAAYHDRVEGETLLEVASHFPRMIAALQKAEHEEELRKLADDDIPF